MAPPHRMLPRLIVAALGLLLCAARDPEVERGLELFGRLEYDRAIVLLQKALARPGLAPEDQRAALETIAFAYTVLEDQENAARSFGRLLDLEPGYEVPASRSPRLRQGFQAAAKRWGEGRRVSIDVRLDEEQVHAVLTGDPERRREVRVLPEGGEPRALACVGERCDAPRPRESFSVEVLDHRGQRLAREGPFAGRPEPSAIAGPWLWVALGAAAAVGGALALGFALQPQPPEGSLGRLPLP